MSMQTHVVSTAVDLLGEILETLQESLKHNIPIVTHFPPTVGNSEGSSYQVSMEFIFGTHVVPFQNHTNPWTISGQQNDRWSLNDILGMFDWDCPSVLSPWTPGHPCFQASHPGELGFLPQPLESRNYKPGCQQRTWKFFATMPTQARDSTFEPQDYIYNVYYIQIKLSVFTNPH